MHGSLLRYVSVVSTEQVAARELIVNVTKLIGPPPSNTVKAYHWPRARKAVPEPRSWEDYRMPLKDHWRVYASALQGHADG